MCGGGEATDQTGVFLFLPSPSLDPLPLQSVHNTNQFDKANLSRLFIDITPVHHSCVPFLDRSTCDRSMLVLKLCIFYFQ